MQTLYLWVGGGGWLFVEWIVAFVLSFYYEAMCCLGLRCVVFVVWFGLS